MDREHLAVMVKERSEQWGERPALRYKDPATQRWEEISWRKLGEQSQAVAGGLVKLGVQEQEAVGIFSANRPEWTVADYGAQFARAVSVPIYATNSASQARYIVDDAEIKVIFVGSQEHYDKVKSFAGDCPIPPKIVTLDDYIRVQGADLHFSDFLAAGRYSGDSQELAARLEKTSSRDIATLVYTSGTTGDPKGVILTHANFFYQLHTLNQLVEVGPEDVSLCFLPLSHTYERTWTYFILHQGAVNCYCPDFKRVTEYFREVRPTVMVSVPRLYEKIFDQIQSRVKSSSVLSQKLFHWALKVGRELAACRQHRQAPGVFLKLKHALADRLALRQVRETFGGRLRWVVSGGAPLSRELEEFFLAAGILICQGYGLTETAPVIASNLPQAFKFGTVGQVLPGCKVRFSPEGEILVKGPNVMAGYFKKPQATAAAFEDGWFKTGDVGKLDQDGFLRITDRIKDLIITSGGKNISPQIIEVALCRDPYIEQAAVIGNKRKFVGALLVPAFGALEEYARAQGLRVGGREELLSHPQIEEFYDQRVKMQCKELADCEKIKKFSLLAHEFTLEGGELTPTLKLKRKVIEKNYADLIESMYQEKLGD
jgi:long-chain acyl-CoA synthetase